MSAQVACHLMAVCREGRQVEGEQFVSAIAEALEPRMRITGEMDTLDRFKVPRRASRLPCRWGDAAHCIGHSAAFRAG